MDLRYITFPKELSDFSIIFLIFSSMFTSFISAAFGIGGGAVFLGLLAIFLNPIALLPVHGSVQIASNFGRMLLMIKDVYKKPILPFLIGTIIHEHISIHSVKALFPFLSKFDLNLIDIIHVKDIQGGALIGIAKKRKTTFKTKKVKEFILKEKKNNFTKVEGF